VLDAPEQALYARQPDQDGTLVYHSGRGSQYVSIRYTERLAEAGISRGRGAGDLGVGVMVQQLSADGAAGLRAACRVRGQLLSLSQS
jgi:hypothetical protein